MQRMVTVLSGCTFFRIHDGFFNARPELFSSVSPVGTQGPSLGWYPGTPILSTPVINITSKSLVVNTAKVLRYLNCSKCALIDQNDSVGLSVVISCSSRALITNKGTFCVVWTQVYNLRSRVHLASVALELGYQPCWMKITPLGVSSGISTSVLELTHCCFLITTLIMIFVFGFI